MDAIMNNVADAMNNSLGAPLTVFLLSMIPLAEARIAILFGVRMGLSPAQSFGWAFLGSSMLVPILLLILIPTINALSRTKLFSKLGKFLYDKFERKSRSLQDSDGEPISADGETKKRFITKKDLKKMGGVALFVAVPIPMTGVWTGSAVASITKIGFVKGLIGIILGNAVACGILTLISFLFGDYVNYIIYGFLAIVIIVVAVLIIKLIIFKPKDETTETQNNDDKTE